MTVSALLGKHREMRERLERRFHEIRMRYASRMQCSRGCARCCRGLFDIPLPDAFRVARAYGALGEEVRASVAGRAARIHRRLLLQAPGLGPPFFLTSLSEDEIDRLVEALTGTACPFLDGEERCLIYDFRPLACLLEGIPMVDLSDGLFGDWCDLNFREGVSAEMERHLALDYYEIEATESALSEALAEHVLGIGRREVRLFIPSIVAGYADYWAPAGGWSGGRGMTGSTGGWRP
ncbi:MAG: YkgJ family cysteine cluster protein [Acidobacteria bacterium]|nr:YkgJ family cysteine cluster protein [Acidobacteriota bacterium]